MGEQEDKFTAGPWTPEFGETYNVRAPHGGILCQIHHLKGRGGLGGRVPGDEAAANTRLLAAAPDLLQALRELESAGEVFDTSNGNGSGPAYFAEAMIAARAALAKATQSAA